MRAMILAAGLGTRLRPLTDDRPKALVEVAGHTLLEITLRRLHEFGVREVIVNVHHFADMVVDYLKKNDNFGMRIEISRENVLLDTGGGLKKAAWFFLEDGTCGRARFFFTTSTCSARLTFDAWRNFISRVGRWRRWPCRSARHRDICCSMNRISSADGELDAIGNQKLSGLHRKRRRWPSLACISFLSRLLQMMC